MVKTYSQIFFLKIFDAHVESLLVGNITYPKIDKYQLYKKALNRFKVYGQFISFWFCVHCKSDPEIHLLCRAAKQSDLLFAFIPEIHYTWAWSTDTNACKCHILPLHK